MQHLNQAGSCMKLLSVCSWIYQSRAPWHLILWKHWQIRLWISHWGLLMYYSLICGSCK